MPKSGGEPFDPDKFHAAVLRADMNEVAARVCFHHASKVVDAILANFVVTPRSIKEKRTA
jgi:hypothetical protein